jgi:class 3 adenylate cyclase
VLVGRQEELSQLEDALLSANRSDGRFVLLAGEAGIGKTRLATELTRRARKLGCSALWGSCSEAELSLPYLPFVEAIGNQLGEHDLAQVRAELGPMSGELAQLFPQLGNGAQPAASGDPAQAKLRMFESVVTLLELWARDRGLLLVVDDVHWADSSTRHLLDYVARRMATSRVMVLATYRSDELDRRHPLTRMVQVWQRTGAAETVTVDAMTPGQVTEMIAAILDAESVSAELGSLVHDRSEGNPFVLEEFLREALDRREIVRTDTGWERPPLDALRLPETVREAVLLRVGRLDPVHVDVLRAGAVLGRSFDYGMLVEVAAADEGAVLTALEEAVAQQLLEEEGAGDRYTWRHALTQEAIASDTVLPKRQRIHSRAADALERRGGSAMAVASHLLNAGRANEAAGACLRAAEEAERSVAFREAAELLEHVLPHVADPHERALLLSRMGRLRWYNGEPAAAEQLLIEAVQQLSDLGYPIEAAEARIHLGRSQWELDQTQAAMEQFEHARAALEKEGPSADLALVYVRIAGIHAFQLDYDRCRAAAERAVEIAEEASADFERLWALSFVAVGNYGTGRELALLDECFHEAFAKGYAIIASNTLYNAIWNRVHSVAGDFVGALETQERMIFHNTWVTAGGEIARSWAFLEWGELTEALEQGRRAADRHEGLGAPKFEWRGHLAATEALVELGRTTEAEVELPPPSPADELQDIVYDTPARVRVALALGQVDKALELGRRVAAHDRVLIFPKAVALGVEALVAGGATDEAAALLGRAKRAATELGQAALAIAEARILLASERAAEARPLLQGALRELESSDLRIWTWQARTLAADAAAATGDRDTARSLLESCIRDAHAAGAARVRDEARAAAERLGLELPQLVEEPEAQVAEPSVLQAGERLVTSMFADVRGYTPMASASAPEELADRLLTLHRWAAAEVSRRNGIVDKFAGDAVMATFNVAGPRIDHAVLALEAALALRDKAAIMDLPVGIGIAVGPAVVSRSVDAANVSVLGPATNLAARLQQSAAGGEILLSDEAFRRVSSWLTERGMTAEPEELELKGFDGTQPAYRLQASVPVTS